MIVKTDNSYYTAIADAVRAKNGATDTYLPSDMAAAIAAIQAGNDSALKQFLEGALAHFDYPDGLTAIRDYGLAYMSGVTFGKMPDTVTTVGKYGYYNSDGFAPTLSDLSTNLADVGVYGFANTGFSLSTLPVGVTIYKGNLFRGCVNIMAFYVQASVTTIENYSYYGCTGMEMVVFRGQPETVGANAFYQCSNLTAIYVPWNEGEVANAPWGASNATIHYAAQTEDM